MADILSSWREENTDLPVMVWKEFFQKVSLEINPLISEERLRLCSGFLMMSGDVRQT